MSNEVIETNPSEEDGITITETLIKMEPIDEDDSLMMSDTGNFLTVLVPEKSESDDIKPLKCSKCSSIVQNYVLDKSGENNILCQKCQNSINSSVLNTQSKKVLLNAISNCKNTLPFRCHYCSKTFDAKETFYNHIRLHAAKKKNPYLCGMCGKNFKELIQFKKHICARNVLKCNRCSKQFESIFRLENHYLIHSKYKCDQCGKCLSSKTVLEEHKRVHTNEYPFKCNSCNRQFRQKSKYNGHMFTCKPMPNLNQKKVDSKPETFGLK
ncbi:hypothetical protein PGB90_005734 [Kerria lacca]